ncbi:hypothetical protein EG327_000413 [Venturia inaequalis]|uniref:ubiquitinyl hydrolase 1 n=1 Tax=Venturia inaequalis TaxID=5025 RepID=A0A8H3VNJ7_VENIN|nr:hypothetical protein EG327_000413 [Venturia inaequalis]
MNGQPAFMSTGSSFLPLHSYALHGVHQQQQSHHQRGHPTQGQFSGGGLAPPSSAGFGGGPLVSELLASSAITTEYANADPVYQAKTASIPQIYTQYRTCRGDGHCGWRAVAFSYFEALIRIGDPHKILEEEARLKSLCNILNDAGFEEHLYEDFMGDTIELLRKTSNAGNGSALLTSAWMQKYPQNYEHFIEGPLRSYCQSHIEPAVVEIEHVGMTALIDVLVKPAGIAVEITYLDRTEGTTPNVYRFAPEDNPALAQTTLVTFRLLYRPGHYDILYKQDDFPPKPVPIQQQDILVALNYHSTEPIHQKIPFDMGIELPGGSFFTPQSVGWSGFQQYDFAPAPTTLQVESPRAAPTPSYAAPVVHAPEFTPQAVPITPPAVTTLGIPHHPVHHPPIDRGGPFRPSVWEYETNIAPSAPDPSLCQTAIFRKSSHYNTAHFNNPDFEPVQWQPGNDYHQPGDRGRKRSSHSQ